MSGAMRTIRAIEDDAALVELSRNGERDAFARIVERGELEPLVMLTSGGDCSHLGLVWHDELRWISYYSSRKGKASSYLAKVRFQ